MNENDNEDDDCHGETSSSLGHFHRHPLSVLWVVGFVVVANNNDDDDEEEEEKEEGADEDEGEDE